MHAGKRRKPVSVESYNYFEQQNGLVTTLYPHETIPVPDNGRYRLHNEIDDCIVCDLCAKICPVDCIDIEAIKSTEEIGKTSDGSSKRLYAATFDIDMAKCCYCGLCTTVCPTECLTMTKTYDFSEFNVWDMNYHFANLSPEEAEEKKKIYEESQRLKAELKKQQAAEKAGQETKTGLAKPKIAGKPAVKKEEKKEKEKEKEKEEEKEKESKVGSLGKREGSLDKEAGAKPKFKPVIKPAGVKKKEKEKESGVGSLENGDKESKPSPSADKPKPKIKPIIKPVVKKEKEEESGVGSKEKGVESKEKGEKSLEDGDKEPKPKIKPIIKPVIKPKKKDNDQGNESN